MPVDSEHSAIAQALRSGSEREVSRLVLTASGGPFRGRTRESLVDVTPREALAHPTWDMGLVVTTNSSTLVNKGLEVIEAHHLFGVPYDRIEVTVHPQSIVHSMVEFVDGSTIAQASPPDMRLPISLGLGWPDRVAGVGVPLDWTTSSAWTFEPLDDEAFPAVRLAKRVGEAGSTWPAVFNAANEQAVTAFHAGRIGYLDILDTVERVVDAHEAGELTLESVLEAEVWARRTAEATARRLVVLLAALLVVLVVLVGLSLPLSFLSSARGRRSESLSCSCCSAMSASRSARTSAIAAVISAARSSLMSPASNAAASRAAVSSSAACRRRPVARGARLRDREHGPLQRLRGGVRVAVVGGASAEREDRGHGGRGERAPHGSTLPCSCSSETPSSPSTDGIGRPSWSARSVTGS